MLTRSFVRCLAALALLLTGCVAGCAGGSSARTHPATAVTSRADAAVPAPAGRGGAAPRKVMVIAEENETYAAVIGNPAAPNLNAIAARYGTARAVQAGYPVHCPSL